MSFAISQINLPTSTRALTLRVRVALIGLSLTLAIASLGYGAVHGWFPSAEFSWSAASLVCAIATLLWYRSAGTLDCVERELLRTAAASSNWNDARRIVDPTPVAVAWNDLLCRACRDLPIDEPKRTIADLDDEVVTLARAMRELPAAWFVTDCNGCIRLANLAAAELFATIDRRSFVGKDIVDLLEMRKPAATANDELLRQQELDRMFGSVRMLSLRREITVASRPLHIRISRSRMAGRSGDGEGMAWIVEDVTQQWLVAKSRDQFLMTATHELRTPLGNLMAYAETLASNQGIDIEKQKEFCNVLFAEANRLSRLVDHLLSVGQMEVGSLVIAHSDVDIGVLVAESIDNVRSAAQAKSHEIDIELSPKLPIVCGDRDKLNAVLVNLLGNAIKYTPPGGHIHIRSFADDEHVRIEVRDDGLGISEAELPHIFDQFFRGTDPGVMDESGNGLGLSFASEVARLHHGEIEVQSRLGEGSIFTLRLPIAGDSKSGLRH